ncbi:MAG: FtsX-like permease family protein [Prolixibacteraceae bacterium]|jgi:ABC-type lipoprotein release transport system permease subunit|nr:FtsX-like permease family protein [Prolixibacteraceae bacterium]
MIASVAWRNIWRNPVRSGVIIAAIAIGMFAGVFTTTFVKGWMDQRLEAGVETEVSHIQIHDPKFTENYELKKYIPDGVQLSEEILQDEAVNGTSPRIVVQSMIASSETGTGVRIMGIDPEKEKTVTNLYTKVMEGDYFESVSRNPVLIGKKLAKKLKVKLHSKLVITLQDAEGHIVGGAFRVCGIYNASNGMFEEMNVFVRNTDLARLAALDQTVAHEIVVHLKEPQKLEMHTSTLLTKYSGLDVQNWKQLTPELGYINEIGNMYTYMFVVIILLALGFGIVNTMLMVVLERVKELGMLMAVGMSKARVFWMLMLETVLLTLTGGAAGILLGLGVTYATMKNGIDLSMYATGMEDWGYTTHIFPTVETEMVAVISILVIVTGILASIYPARKALKYNPAEAIRTE